MRHPLRGAPRDALLADSVEPEFRGRAFGFHRSMDQLGADDARTNTPEAFSAMVNADLIRFAKVVKAAGVKAE